jgi:hypothetical protein
MVRFKGVPFEQCSSAEALRVSVAIGLALKPGCRLFTIMDGSLLDDDGVELLREMAEAHDAQFIIEQVKSDNPVRWTVTDGRITRTPEEVAS